MARPLRIEYPGAVYHVVCRGNNRQNIFKDGHDRKRYLDKLISYCELKEVSLLCYCLLSNHVHLLMETPQGNLSKLMQPFQTSYTMYFNRRHHRSGHVFEQCYKAFVIDRDNYLLQVSRYIHRNAVEARLVQRPQDYFWSSYGAYVNRRRVRGLTTSTVLEQMGGKQQDQIRNYRKYVENAAEGISEDPPPTIKQVVIGDEQFAEEVSKKRRAKGVKSFVDSWGCNLLSVLRSDFLSGPRVIGVAFGGGK